MPGFFFDRCRGRLATVWDVPSHLFTKQKIARRIEHKYETNPAPGPGKHGVQEP